MSDGQVAAFFYGTLKSDGRLNILLRDTGCELIEPVVVAGYTLVSIGHSFPAAIPSWKDDGIEGEEWAVPTYLLRTLDTIENVPLMFRREPATTTCNRSVQLYVWSGQIGCAIGNEYGRRWNNRTRRVEVDTEK